jgi:hypothetical protein
MFSSSVKAISRLLTVYLIVSVTAFTAASAASTRAPKSCPQVFEGPFDGILALGAGSNSFSPADDEARKILRRSPRVQAEAVSYIQTIYRKVPKKIVIPGRAQRFGGRRLLDRALTLIKRSDLKFKENLAAGLTVKQAFAEILDQQAQGMGSNYSSMDVETVLEVLNADLKRQQQAIGGYPLALVVGGSFVNGKANLLESDVDISVNNASMVKTTKGWPEAINEALRVRHENINLTVELHGEPASFYGALNPFVFEISQKGVRLLVFPPAYASQGPLEASAPDIYEWN